MIVARAVDTVPAYKWAEAEQHFANLLKALNVTEPSTEETPRRFVKMLHEMFTEEPWQFTTFPIEEHKPGEAGDKGIVTVTNIPFVSLCAHHFAPFTGKAHVAYIPKTSLPGLSKIARLVNSCAKGPQVQENIGCSVADFLMFHLEPLGVMVILTAEHTCMTIRGIKAHNTTTVTSVVRGAFHYDLRAREEALALINMGRHIT